MECSAKCKHDKLVTFVTNQKKGDIHVHKNRVQVESKLWVFVSLWL